MIIDLLTLIATSALAFGAIRISTQANEIAEQSADTALEAVKVEVDKHIFEWGQRCLNCASRVSSLRLLEEGVMDESIFKEERRTLCAELYALKDEGSLFFEKAGEKDAAPCIAHLATALELMKYNVFLPPEQVDKTTRYNANREIRTHVQEFRAAIQVRVGHQWAEN